LCQTAPVHDPSLAGSSLAALRRELEQLRAKYAALEAEKAALYSTQESRVAAIKKIGELENRAMLEQSQLRPDISLPTLMSFDVDRQYAAQNPVVTAFVDAVTATPSELGLGSRDTRRVQLVRGKTLSRLVAVEALARARNSKSIGPLSFLLGLGLYNRTGSRAAVDLCSHLLPSATYKIHAAWRKGNQGPPPKSSAEAPRARRRPPWRTAHRHRRRPHQAGLHQGAGRLDRRSPKE